MGEVYFFLMTMTFIVSSFVYFKASLLPALYICISAMRFGFILTSSSLVDGLPLMTTRAGSELFTVTVPGISFCPSSTEVVLTLVLSSNRESLRDVVLATEAHASKAHHLGFGKYVAKNTIADANTKRDYRIFEEFAYKVIAEVRRCRIVDIFKLNGNAYAFDSTIVDLSLSTFEWALFGKRKGGVKVNTLYDLETQIPTFFHITPAEVHDTYCRRLHA